MALQFSRNNSGDGDAILFALKEHLVNNGGWTVESSSNASVYNASGDEWTTVGDVDNNNSWTRLSKNGRELCIQRGGTARTWQGKYSRSAGFTGGSPSTTVMPTATDEEFFSGTGPGAAFDVNWFNAGALVYHIMVDDDPSNNEFYLAAYQSGFGLQSLFGMDQMISGTAEGDPDPYCIMWGYDTGTVLKDPLPQSSNLALANTGTWRGFYAAGLGGENWVAWRAYEYSDQSTGTGAPRLFGDNPFTTKKQTLPVVIGRDSGDGGSSGIKGLSNLCKWACGAASNHLDIYDGGGGSGEFVQFNDMIFPWGGGPAPLS